MTIVAGRNSLRDYLVASYNASNPTYYNPNENFYTYSQTFSNAIWNPAAVTITDNNTTAPDGTLTGALIVPDTNSGLHRINQVVTATAGVTYTYSIYAKAAGYQYFYLNAGQILSINPPTFDLFNGTVANPGSGHTATITPAGRGWYRCTVSAQCATTQTFGIYHQVNTVGNVADHVYAGNGTSGIYLWGAQFERGSIATPYTPTTSASVNRSTTLQNAANPGTYDCTLSSAVYWDAGGTVISGSPFQAKAPSFYFNGSGATPYYITNYNLPASYWAGPWTVIATIKSPVMYRGGGDQQIVSHGIQAQRQGLHLAVRGGYPYLGLYSDDLSGSTLLADNTWYVLAYTQNPLSFIKRVYVNGYNDGNSTGGGAYNPNSYTNTEIGRYTWSTGGMMYGYIAEVNFYNAELSPDQILRQSKAQSKE